MPHPHKATLEKANAAIVRGDYEGFLKFCTEDTEWTFVGDQTLKGKEAVRRWMAAVYKEPPQFQVERMIADAVTVVAMGDISIKDDKGHAMPHAYCDVWRFRDGLMAKLDAFVVAKSPKRKLS